MTHRLVIIGAAGHAHLVLNDLPRFPQVCFCAYAPSFPGEDVSLYAAHPSATAGPPLAYNDWRSMLEAELPDIVVVCGRFDLNGPLAIAALERGCKVISEKPAAQTLAQVARLRQLVAEGGAPYGMMLNMRYDPPYYTARKLVRQGVIGEPYLVTAQKSYRWGASRPAWYAHPAHYGSTMTWVGIHAFDYARWISGAEYREVYAYHGNLVHTERPGCQDVATVIARLSNSGSATFNLDFLRPSAALTHGDDRLRIAGSEGVLEICDQGTRLEVITAAEYVRAWPLEGSGRTLLSDFVAAMEGHGELLVSPEEAFSSTEFAIYAAQAAESGQVIRIP